MKKDGGTATAASVVINGDGGATVAAKPAPVAKTAPQSNEKINKTAPSTSKAAKIDESDKTGDNNTEVATVPGTSNGLNATEVQVQKPLNGTTTTTAVVKTEKPVAMSNEEGVNGNKKVNKPKWTRVPIDLPPAKPRSTRRPERSPRRRRNDDYYDDYYERPPRRGPRRGGVSSSTSYPRGGGGSSSRYSRGGSTISTNPRRGYITRSNRPSYTESPNAQALNGHVPAKTAEMAEKRVTTPSGSRISAESPAFIMPPHIYGPFYYTGPTTFMLDTNVKESIKKQM